MTSRLTGLLQMRCMMTRIPEALNDVSTEEGGLPFFGQLESSSQLETLIMESKEEGKNLTRITLTSLSAMVAETCTFPIDITKTRLQLHRHTLSSSSSSFKVAACQADLSMYGTGEFMRIYSQTLEAKRNSR
ncbi:Mitochondrial substrate/solute carrier [Dillenia turbinata]|uniref:Mitochondrial substrate/solute carrier n=1 Tax=Dillenia turbinata TaxID=194707 RepID=A0AAN8V6S9_9MAGN